MSSKVPIESFSTALSFIEALDSSRWSEGQTWTCPWVFRGQVDANWGLTPSAWREPSTDAQRRLAAIKDHVSRTRSQEIRAELNKRPSTRDANHDFIVMSFSQAKAEESLLTEFVELADSLGFQVPGQALLKTQTRSGHPFLPGSYPLLRFMAGFGDASALAQHHSVPTRALDWSRKPYNAAFFAASEVPADSNVSELAVWAINSELVNSLSRSEKFRDDFSRFQFLHLPLGHNEFLRMQDGLFSYPTYGCSHIARTGEFPKFEAFTVALGEHFNIPLVRKLTLPHSEAGELLRLLWLRGVSRAHLMPSLDNVTEALRLRWRWES